MEGADVVRLRELCERLVQRAEAHPAGASALADAVAKLVDTEAERDKPGGRRSRRRASPTLDPFEIYRDDPDALASRLSSLDLEQLRDVVAHYAMDPRRLVMKWKTPDRVIMHIVETVQARSRKGDAFRTLPGSPVVSNFREYENGVADILSFLVGDEATVERNVRVPGRRGGRGRQVDVFVRGKVFGLENTTLAVDCKLWKRKVMVNDVDRFLGFLDDVAADVGLLVTSSGYSAEAKSRLRHERGARAEIVTIGELAAWSPKGTKHVSFRVPVADAARAAAALRDVGMRVRPDLELTRGEHEVVLVAFAHVGSGNADQQRDLTRRGTEALEAAGLPVTIAASGTSIAGGTPAHRWLEVTDRDGVHLGLKVLAATEIEVQQQLNSAANHLGVARDKLDVERPKGWPVTGLFGLPT